MSANDEYKSAIERGDLSDVDAEQLEELRHIISKTINSGRFKNVTVTWTERHVPSTDKNGKPHVELVRTPVRLKDQLKNDALNSALMDILDPNSPRANLSLEEMGMHHARKVARPYEKEQFVIKDKARDEGVDKDGNDTTPVAPWDDIRSARATRSATRLVKDERGNVIGTEQSVGSPGTSNRNVDWQRIANNWGVEPIHPGSIRARQIAEAKLAYETRIKPIVGEKKAEFMREYVDTDYVKSSAERKRFSTGASKIKRLWDNSIAGLNNN